VRIVAAQNRPVAPRSFEHVGSALGGRQRLELAHHSRGRDERGRREVSPQRLVHWRNAWYLDAFCHRVEALRTFALDAIEEARLLDRKALDDGSWALRLPFSASAELEMDILRHGETVEVVGPPELRDRIAARLGPVRYDRAPWPCAPRSTSSSCRSPTSTAASTPTTR
jgi:predicted DNA-binding transcriptional regulator YafY